jgi:hypothetical protein
MAYCGQYGCSCSGKNCDKCGNWEWHHNLNGGLCLVCINEEEIERLKKIIEKKNKIILRFIEKMKHDRIKLNAFK